MSKREASDFFIGVCLTNCADEKFVGTYFTSIFYWQTSVFAVIPSYKILTNLSYQKKLEREFGIFCCLNLMTKSCLLYRLILTINLFAYNLRRVQ